MTRAADLETGLRRAREFLRRTWDPADGLWHDFTSTAGASSEWVTGFVLASLPGWDVREARDARRALLGCVRADGSWGFCPRVPGDADSTSWALLALGSDLTGEPRVRAERFLRDQQRPGDGGFRTYPEAAAAPLGRWAPHDHGYRGWQEAHTCVTGTVLLALPAAGLPPERRRDATRYLQRRQDSSGIWPSYWWSGLAFSTCQALRALSQCGQLPPAAAVRAAAELARRQLPSGGWAWDGSTSGPAGSFETAFALRALLTAEQAGAAHWPDCIQRGLGWLIRHQDAAGGWPVRPILRVPMPGDRQERFGAYAVPHRRGGLGADTHGVFTAAAVASCLAARLDGGPNAPVASTVSAAPSAPQPGTTLVSRPATAAGPLLRRPPGISPVLRYLATREAQAALWQTMSSHGLAIAPAARAAILAQDRSHGRRIAASLPAPSRGCRSFTTGWLREVAATLGFGWGMTRTLAARQGLPFRSQAAELGAVLVIGTAAVDRLCDSAPPRRDALLALLRPDHLRTAAIHDGNPVARAARDAADPDIRYALGLAADFFARLRRCELDHTWRSRVMELLVQALDAERASLLPPGARPASEDVGRAHVAARVLPFQVIAAAQCGLHHHDCPAGSGLTERDPAGRDPGRPSTRCVMTAQLLGEAIAAVDDLADVCADAASGAANSLLDTIPPGQGGATGTTLSTAEQAIIAALASGACWASAATVCQRVTWLLDGRVPRTADVPPPVQRVLAYLWGWGNLGRPALGVQVAPRLPRQSGRGAARDGISRA